MTKRILGILVAVLMVMSLIPVSAFAKEAKTFVPTRDTQTWDFEGETDGWTFVDNDGDGYNWELASVAMAGYIIPAYSGADCISSKSYDADAGALNPDNWAITPAITADDLSAVTMTFWAQAQDASYPQEHFGVAVGNSADPSEMVMVQEWDMTASVTRASGNWYQYTVNLNGVQGVEAGTIYFAIRHFNCSDWFYLNVDTVEVTVDASTPVDPTEPPVDPTEPPAPPAEGNATVILNVPEDHWEDGTGYQMLLDADATAYGTIIPETGGLTTSGDASDAVYAEFEYKIPENADGVLTTSNIVSCASIAIEIPAGVYDWCITNPTPGDRMWIASAQGNVGGRYDNYEFLAGYTYEFVVTLQGSNDAVNVTITDPSGEQPPVPDLDEALNVEGGNLHFETDATYPWEVFQDGSRWAAWSGNKGVGGSTSTLTTTVNAVAGDTISFDFMAWGEGSYSYWDHCDFYVNDEQVLYYGALDNDWESYTYTFEADGEYVLTWSYTKDGSVNPTGDYFAIDEVAFSGEVVVEPTEPPVDPTEPPVDPTEPPVLDDLDRALNIEGGTIHFESTGNYPWVTVTEGNRFYAKSGNAGVASTSSTVTTTVTVEAGDIAQFEFKAWGEGSSTYWDHCDFFVNGSQQFTYGAYDNDWEQFIYFFPAAGTYTLTWTYTKDSSVNPTGDYFAVDNVYVGEPVHVEEIIASESLEVPVNRTAAIEWTVLPEAASNKGVTFAVDDPTIATVNENGVVFGVAEGETFVTIASAENPQIFTVCEITVIDTGLGLAQIYGICTYDFGGTYDDTWVNFTDVDPGTFTTLAAAPGAYAACYAYGTVFGYTTEGDFFTADINNLGAPTFTAGAFTSATVTTMTFDYVTGTIYAIGADDYNSYLFAIDPASGAVTTIATISNHLYGICADENGVIYGIDSTGALYTVDKATGAQTLVGNTGVACSYVQDICYDFNTGDIYWAQILAGEADEGLYRVDKNSAVATYCGALGPSGAEIVGMFIIPDEEPGGGDEVAVTGVTINPAEVTIRVGDTAQFTASVQPFNADNKNVEWSVDDEDIIMVDQNGLVVGLAEGTAMVCVTTEDGGYEAYAIVNVIPPLGELLQGNYFETQAQVDEWTFVDKDGDGHNWLWNQSAEAQSYLALTDCYEGAGMIFSESYYNPDYLALNPDNWAISPAVTLPEDGGSVTLWAKGQDPSYAAEHFMIYAGTSMNPDEMVPVSAEYVVNADWTQYDADLTQFAGETVYVAIRHFHVTDMFIIDVDQVEIWANEGGLPPVPPTHLWGDANGDGIVDSTDVVLLMRYAMDLQDLEEENLDPWCDVNGDGAIDMTDALLVARYVTNVIPELPCF